MSYDAGQSQLGRLPEEAADEIHLESPNNSGDIHIVGARYDVPTKISNQRLNRLELDDVIFRADVTISNCRIRTVDLANIRLVRGAGLAIRNCVIEDCRLRSFATRCGLSIEHSKLEALDLHDVSPLSIHATAIEGIFRVSRLRSKLEISESSSDQLLIMDSDDHEASISIRIFSSNRDIRIEGGEVRSITMKDVSARDLSVRRALAHCDGFAVHFEDTTVVNNMSLDAISSLNGSALSIESTRIGGSLLIGSLDVGRHASMRARLIECNINGNLTISEQRGSMLTAHLIRAHVSGDLRVEGLKAHIADARQPLLCVEDSTAASLNLPNVRYRGKKAIRQLCESIFTKTDLDTLGLLRTSFAAQHRALSEDATYALMQDKMTDGDRFGWLKKFILGATLGWGVQLWPPVRAIMVLLLVTMCYVFTSVTSGGWPYRIYASAIEAVALWTNISTSENVSREAFTYSTAQVLCGSLGLLFTTLIIGIAIRRLVR